MLPEGRAWCQPSKVQAIPGTQAGSQRGVHVCQLMYIRQVTLILHQLPVTASTARLWGLHKPLHHLFSQYHQHHTYCLEDSCQLQLNHHFFWPCADAGLQTHSPISHQMSPLSLIFLSSTMSAPWHPKRRNAQKLGFVVLLVFVFSNPAYCKLP